MMGPECWVWPWRISESSRLILKTVMEVMLNSMPCSFIHESMNSCDFQILIFFLSRHFLVTTHLTLASVYRVLSGLPRL